MFVLSNMFSGLVRGQKEIKRELVTDVKADDVADKVNGFLGDRLVTNVKADGEADKTNQEAQGTKSIVDRTMKQPNDVLNNYLLDKIRVIKKSGDEGKEIKVELFTTKSNELIDLDIKGSWKGDWNPYFGATMRDFNIGVKNNINEHLSTDVGFKQNDTSKIIHASGQYSHPAVVINAGLEGFMTPVLDPTSLKLSAMFGHQFDSVGLLAGFDMKKSSSGSLSLCDFYKVATFGAVFPSTVIRFDMKPNDALVATGAWKVNENFEIAACLRTNWRFSSWSHELNELGVLYKASDANLLGAKIDYGGRLTLGSWWKSEAWKLGLCAQTSVKNSGGPIKYGVMFEF